MKKHSQIFCMFIAVVIVIGGISNSRNKMSLGKVSSSDEFPSEGIYIQEVKPYKILNVPYESMVYDPYYGDAAACLSMLSEYYGDKVEKTEINPIVGADYIGGGGISMQGFVDAAIYDDYSTRDYGYYVDIDTLDGKTYEERWTYIKNYINKGIPLITISKIYQHYPTHHRLIIGYDERTEMLFMHDPWVLDVEPVYQGPKAAMSIQNDTWMDVQWSYNDYTIAIVQPIKVCLTIESGPVLEAGSFILKCEIDNGFMNHSKNIRLEITLPNGYSLLNGTSTMDITSIRGKATRAWEIACPIPTSSHQIKVTAKTFGEAISYGGVDRIFPGHPQAFIRNVTSNYQNDITPYKADITAEVNCSGDITASLHCFSLLPNTRGEGVNTTYSEVSFEIATEIKCETGPNHPEWLVYCWFKLGTEFGNLLSNIVVLSTYDSDSDGDELSDFDEETIYFTNPLSNDTDLDRLSDFDEIFEYGTNPNSVDSDGDGMNDYDEIEQGFDPLDPKSSLLMKNLILALSISLPTLVVIAIPLAVYFVIKKKKNKLNDEKPSN
ncbi:MAG: C39 family peptidase [Candidatus Heimdallarchaeota archaeon]